MRKTLISLVAGFALAQSVAAQQLPSDPAQAVIQQQLNAFMADDFQQAFTYASPMIKQAFRTTDRFEAMVKSGFPMVWRPADVKFLGQKAMGPVTRQQVMITDQAGTLHMLEYEMLQTDEGMQINGVRFIRGPQAGA